MPDPNKIAVLNNIVSTGDLVNWMYAIEKRLENLESSIVRAQKLLSTEIKPKKSVRRKKK